MAPPPKVIMLSAMTLLKAELLSSIIELGMEASSSRRIA